jgi:hypothetical protein
MYSLPGVIIVCVLFALFLGGAVYVAMMDEPRHPKEGWWTEPENEEHDGFE